MSWWFPNWRKLIQRCEPLLPGFFVSGFVVALSPLGLIQALDDTARDVLFRWRGEQPWNEQVVLIAIDRQTIQELGPITQLRPYYVDLLDFLSESGNRIVAFDIILSEATEYDETLATAIANHNGVILAVEDVDVLETNAESPNSFYSVELSGEDLDSNSQLSSAAVSQELPQFHKEAISSGHIFDNSDDFDGVTRRHRSSIGNTRSLAVSTALTYSFTTDILNLPPFKNEEMLLNWPAAVEKLPSRSLLDVLQRKIPAKDFRGKTIIVGATALGTDDWIRTPFNKDEPVYGVYAHAAALHTLLEENWLRTPNPYLVSLLLLVVGPLISFGLQGLSFLRQVGIWVIGTGSWLIIGWVSLHQNYALPIAAPLLVFGLTESFIVFTDRLRSSAMLQARNEFLGTMSHELRTPLNAIIGISEMMQETPLNPKQREFSETIQNSSQALLALINDVLDFSKIEAGKLVLEDHPVNIRNSVEESLDIVATRASNKPLDLVYMLDPEVPPVVISDPIRLRQILLNLLSNAVKFTDEGEVSVIVQPSPSDELGAPVARWSNQSDKSVLLLFAVRDTGIGIPEERIAQIFEPFRQASTSTTRKYGGTGLGLTISRRLAETMGGRLWVESELDEGSTFFFTIRTQIDPVTVQPERPAALLNWANQKILVIDNNKTRRTSLNWQLESLDIEVIESRSVAEAQLLVQQGQQFDGIILDAAIANHDSVSIIESLRRAMGKPNVPSIILADLQENLESKNPDEIAIVWKPVKQASMYRALMKINPNQAVAVVDDVSGTVAVVDEPLAVSLTVLIADDNPVNQRVAQHMLQLLGHESETVSTGAEAIEAVEQSSYDVVLMDMRMPEMSGIEATRRIRQMGKTISQPWIIAMTANASSEDRAHCLKAGMNDYMSKPIRRDNLAKILSDVEPAFANQV